ncbi:acetolactate synthase [Desulfuromonas versatilis]|uniref:Acetolactate synthase n=1 Tax=Desulfuromonas versatilis TaxID=2802975 RepID=A0ABM8HR44_9BACT|nr:thiamine pyrophosphate-binding protein [Desulfuromonas versatilis]BCR04377.1 acetolactate synthase [Desulfuromonas versatilis]
METRAFSNSEPQAFPADEKKPELGDLVVEYLEEIGVEYVFGVPGGAIEPLYNAMARSARRGGLRPVIARHEAGAAFMADGYARETGKLGVCCSTTGPGATNLITGVASAYVDSIPLLVLTAQTALPQFGKRTLQESSCTAVNTVAMFQSCTRFSSLVSHRGQLEGKLLSAILATQGPPAGPAHLSIPMDVLSSPRRQRADEYKPLFKGILKRHEMTNMDAIESLRGEITKCSHPVIVVGEDCGEAMPYIMEIAELIKAPIVSGPAGKRWVNHTHPQYRGVIGYAGHPSADAVIKNERVDLILAIGTRLDDLIFGPWERDKAFQEKLVQVDLTAEQFTRAPLARLHVCGTLSAIFRMLMENIRGEQAKEPLRVVKKTGPSVPPQAFPPSQITLNEPEKFCSEASPIKPQRLMREIVTRFPASTRFIIDAGNSWAWSIHYLLPKSSGLFRIGMGYGAMGWAIGASVGTAFGCPDSPAVCVTGDGSWLMSGQELTVATAEKLSVVFVILNDQALGMVKHGQRLGGAESVGFELPPIDYAGMAKAMGARAFDIRTIQEWESLDVNAICRHPGPTVLNVRIDGEEVPPMGLRMRNLGGKN